jgi:hypothetical protein
MSEEKTKLEEYKKQFSYPASFFLLQESTSRYFETKKLFQELYLSIVRNCFMIMERKIEQRLYGKKSREEAKRCSYIKCINLCIVQRSFNE